MNKYEHRRQRLIELISLRYGGQRGSIASLGKDTGIPPSYISRMLHEEGNEGKRPINEKFKDKIEHTLLLTPGWLDMPLGTPLNRKVSDADHAAERQNGSKEEEYASVVSLFFLLCQNLKLDKNEAMNRIYAVMSAEAPPPSNPLEGRVPKKRSYTSDSQKIA